MHCFFFRSEVAISKYLSTPEKSMKFSLAKALDQNYRESKSKSKTIIHIQLSSLVFMKVTFAKGMPTLIHCKQQRLKFINLTVKYAQQDNEAYATLNVWHMPHF